MDNVIPQNEELLALQSIFESDCLTVENEDPPKGRFIVHVSVPENFQICYYDSNQEKQSFVVEYLPPLNIFFEYPKTYPSKSCAAFLLSCSWLTLDQLSQVCLELESMWQRSEDVILYQWVNFLQDEILQFLNILDVLDVTKLSKYKFDPRYCCGVLKREISCAIPVDSPDSYADSSNENNVEETSSVMRNKRNVSESSEVKRNALNLKPSTTRGNSIYDQRAVLDLTDDLVSLLQEYNKYRKMENFKTKWFVCQICLTSRKGKDFVLFNQCNHMYCRDCLTSYFEIQIKEGNVISLNCPAEKCPSQADGTIVKELVSPELFSKYDQLLLSRTLDGMSDVAYCPRQVCQCAVLIESDSTMGCCPKCKFTFCILCRMAYHGIAPCNLRNEQKQRIFQEYMQSKGEARTELEKRYGKRVLKLLVENTLSEEWKDTFSKKCPRCDTNIEKTEGCNKMTCFRCGSFFCWLCMAKLNPVNPYKHFTDSSSACYQKLFPDEFDDDELVEPGEFLDNI